MSNPKITLITATYYRPDLLARAIKSVQNSTFKDYEHVIVSDHCPKAKQVYELFKQDKRIRFFEQEPPHIPNHGARAHNFVIEKKSQTDLFCFLGDDNIILPNYLGIMYEELSSGLCDAVHTKTYSLRIKAGDGGVKKILSRKLEHDLEPLKYAMNDISDFFPRDIGNFGHTMELYEKTGPQQLTGECYKGMEDNAYFKKVDGVAKNIKYLDVCTGVYYDRSGHNTLDKEYHDMVCNLNEDDIFVYPELLKLTGVL